MTHDELLADIEKLTVIDGIFMKDALCAVVELHKPFDDDPDECGHCGDGYPCPTIQAIQEQLK